MTKDQIKREVKISKKGSLFKSINYKVKSKKQFDDRKNKHKTCDKIVEAKDDWCD